MVQQTITCLPPNHHIDLRFDQKNW